ncbi:nuclear transport factor 2 family protein [Microterricola viridarii]|uniref:nuclear transport factor 2 family protein n=1 Tax=Microterricola viridarii TaxID=412690 RepID=UPI000AFE21E3|nr:nuclear transport factor 2 family protein [Microterricola viridarii]
MTSSATPSELTEAPVPADPRVEQIRDLERARLQALVEGDIAAASALHADDFQLVTPIGALLTKAQYLGAVAAGEIDYLAWEPGPIEVRLAGEGATIRYRAELEVVFGGHHVARTGYWHTDSYELNDGAWQAVWSQATEIR